MIKPPNPSVSDVDRKIQLEEQIDPLFADIIDQFVSAGFGTKETIKAMHDVLDHRRFAYDQDPDPADDERYIPEPANDWPSA
jgi:hypothetical protein